MLNPVTRRKRCWLGLVLALLLAMPAVMAASDSNAPIHITADHAELLRNENVSTYTGNVILEREDLVLTGNKLVVKRLSDDSYRAELTGSPATLENTPPASEGEPVDGHSHIIIYTSANQQIEMRGQAVLNRNDDTISGRTIRHDLDTQRSEAEAAPGGNGRVQITLHPDNGDE